jgi:xanthine dehydrogenase accessory factor
MDNLDLLVLRTLCDWRLAGRHAALFTVVRTWGSSPRPIGALMALAADGAVVGSVSGGCVEDDLLHRLSSTPGAWRQPGEPVCTFMRYGVSAEEARRFGLPCGGTLELVAEFDPDAAGLSALVGALVEGQLVRRRVRLADGSTSLAPASAPDNLVVDAETHSQTFGPGYRMLLIGAGQLAEYLATMALFNGFAVTVCDPRREYTGSWNVPGVRLAHDMPDDAVAAFRPDGHSAIIALTHDPKLDDLALIDALATDAMYVGAIGSRRNSAARRERLADHFNVGPDALARLRGPIGLFIGSKTPSEIAVSVMAEVLAVKNGVPLPATHDVASAKERGELQALGAPA